MAPIFYFRGLNTYGDDYIHYGPIRAGKMYAPLKTALEKMNIDFIPVENLMAGPFEETVERAHISLANHPVWQKTASAHFLGHSMGALVARALATKPEITKKTLSVLSFGSPHHGTEAANKVLQLEEKQLLALKNLGWNADQKRKMIRHLTPENMIAFNKKYVDQEGVTYASAVCELPPSELCLPMKILSKASPPEGPSDGLVTVKSQSYGKVIGHFSLDHLTAIGYFPHLLPATKKRRSVEFGRMLRNFGEFWEGL